MPKNPGSKVLQRMYKNLVLSRRYEEKLIELFSEGSIPGWIHSGLGQEATGVALGECLKKEDYLVPYFRSRSSLFAKGLSPKDLTAEIFGRSTGCCGGMSGESHVASKELGILGAGGLIGSPIPIGVGLACAAKLRNKGQIVACAFGDGATSRGAFHEGVNMAAVLELPILFVCENNQYSEFSTLDMQMKIKDIAKRADAYGIPGETVDGNDPVAVYKAVQKGVSRARKGGGPSLIETKTFRMRGHFEGDPCAYRSEEEVRRWREKDPLDLYQKRLAAENLLNEKRIASMEQEVEALIHEAVAFAMESPKPRMEEVTERVYA